jgi:hypothetical protein
VDLLLEIAIRLFLAAYVGVGGWLTMRVLAHAGLRWWWAILLWAPTGCWLVPGAELAGLLAAPIPVILTWAFAYAEWPALIDRGRIGRRSGVAVEPPRLSARARAHTFFTGMDDDDLPSGAVEQTMPHRRQSKPPEEPMILQTPMSSRPAPETPQAPETADAPPQIPERDAAAVGLKRENWMLSGFDDQGRVLRYQVRADDIRACDDGYVVGRNPQVANLVISDDSVSRNHARLRLKGVRLLVEDLGSANGTWIDGRALSPHRSFEVSHGASIEFGGVKLTLTHA